MKDFLHFIGQDYRAIWLQTCVLIFKTREEWIQRSWWLPSWFQNGAPLPHFQQARQTPAQRGTSQSSGTNPCPAEPQGQDPCPRGSRTWGICPSGSWRTELMKFAWLGFVLTGTCHFFLLSYFYLIEGNVCLMPILPWYFGSTHLVLSYRFTVGEEFCLRTNLTLSLTHVWFTSYRWPMIIRTRKVDPHLEN